MKIPLNVGQDRDTSTRAAQTRALEHDVRAAKSGDWNAKNNLARSFAPLLRSLAEKRSHDSAEINRLMEAGREGLFQAARKFRPEDGTSRFQIFALDYIEAHMDGRGKKGFLARLFGR